MVRIDGGHGPAPAGFLPQSLQAHPLARAWSRWISRTATSRSTTPPRGDACACTPTTRSSRCCSPCCAPRGDDEGALARQSAAQPPATTTRRPRSSPVPAAFRNPRRRLRRRIGNRPAIRNITTRKRGARHRAGVLLARAHLGRGRAALGISPAVSASCRCSRTSAVIHPQVKQEFEVGASGWARRQSFAGGAFALFEPSQQSPPARHIVAPEGGCGSRARVAVPRVNPGGDRVRGCARRWDPIAQGGFAGEV